MTRDGVFVSEWNKKRFDFKSNAVVQFAPSPPPTHPFQAVVRALCRCRLDELPPGLEIKPIRLPNASFLSFAKLFFKHNQGYSSELF